MALRPRLRGAHALTQAAPPPPPPPLPPPPPTQMRLQEGDQICELNPQPSLVLKPGDRLMMLRPGAQRRALPPPRAPPRSAPLHPRLCLRSAPLLKRCAPARPMPPMPRRGALPLSHCPSPPKNKRTRTRHNYMAAWTPRWSSRWSRSPASPLTWQGAQAGGRRLALAACSRLQPPSARGAHGGSPAPVDARPLAPLPSLSLSCLPPPVSATCCAASTLRRWACCARIST